MGSSTEYSNNFTYSRKDLIVGSVAMAIVVILLGLGFGLASANPIEVVQQPQQPQPQQEEISKDDYLEEANRILEKYPIIDG